MNQVAAGVHQLRLKHFVNVYFIDAGAPGEWVLIDTSLPGSAQPIRQAAEQLYGTGAKPQAIILTHGHPDHVGSALELAQGWGVAVIAHPLEIPYITRPAYYPPADPTVGGLLGVLSPFFPRELPSVQDVLAPLPLDTDAVPFLPQWRWLHVPGHAPGQIALFRDADRTLIGADAFATAEPLLGLLLNIPKISVAGAPFNYDWEQCRASVQQLAALEPRHIGCGHGPVMSGPAALRALQQLANDFPVPTHGRYHRAPARLDASGIEYLPPPVENKLPRQAAVMGAALLLAGAAWLLVGGRKRNK